MGKDDQEAAKRSKIKEDKIRTKKKEERVTKQSRKMADMRQKEKTKEEEKKKKRRKSMCKEVIYLKKRLNIKFKART